ncbi:UNVERIFIED_CONTAM: Capsl [Trichonephila clavipes]
MDDNNSGDLNMEEFVKGIRDTGLDITDEDAENLFKQFDKDESGAIKYDEFLRAVRGASGTRFHQENIIERHHFDGVGLLFLERGDLLGSRTDLHVQIGIMTGQIYPDVILKQHVHLFRATMGAEFVFMDDNVCSPHENIVNECLQSEDVFRMDWTVFSPDLNPVEHVY